MAKHSHGRRCCSWVLLTEQDLEQQVLKRVTKRLKLHALPTADILRQSAVNVSLLEVCACSGSQQRVTQDALHRTGAAVYKWQEQVTMQGLDKVNESVLQQQQTWPAVGHHTLQKQGLQSTTAWKKAVGNVSRRGEMYLGMLQWGYLGRLYLPLCATAVEDPILNSVSECSMSR